MPRVFLHFSDTVYSCYGCHLIQWLPPYFLSSFFNCVPPGGLWSSSSSFSFWCLCHCKFVGPVLVHSTIMYMSDHLSSSLLPLSALFGSSSVLTRSCHWTMQVFFHLLPCHHHLLFVFHVSHPYSKTGATSVLYSFRFVLLEVFLEHQILFNVENAPLVVRVCFSGLLYHLSPISQISELTYFFYSLSSYKNHFLVLCINCH